jgi:hypothetical protein
MSPRSRPELAASSHLLQDNLHYILGADALRSVRSKVKLVSRDDASLVAEDDKGGAYDYGREGFTKREPDIHAEEWLGVRPQ